MSMLTFKYSAYDGAGARIDGELLAADVEQAKLELHKQRLILIEIKQKSQTRGFSIRGFAGAKVSLSELEFITSELALLLRSGVKLDRGLDILTKGARSPAMIKLLKELADEIKAGLSISESFAKFPDVFDSLYISMIRLGEASGELDQIFSRLAQDLKFRRELQQKIVQAITYPAVIMLVCIASVLFVFNYIVPQMAGIFDNARELPVYTRVLLGVSDWFVQYQIYLAAALVVTGFGLFKAYHNASLRLRLDDILLTLPLIGKAILLVERIRFNASMAMMLQGGISLVKALALSVDVLKNQRLARQMNSSTQGVKQGRSLSAVLSMTPLFTDFNLSLLEVGEESGDLPPVFEEIAERSRQDFQSWVQTLTSMIEPILILVMGAIVGSVVVIMLMSIVSANDIGL